MTCHAFKDKSGIGFICTYDIIDLAPYGCKCLASDGGYGGPLFYRKKKDGSEGAELKGTKQRYLAFEAYLKLKIRKNRTNKEG